ncbi:hypothetical protein EDB92DRAFT_459444 [Lactarius akahatsu]|uniref:Uncharacterized protein n=1 Tax=Lactarius akahatsu TaxID=416441 RepID=A0AAD4LUH1_9AGAM|nr:hypothetical protein EDB92DRAFT_459444 [Lactarius akahatsu]
MGRWNGTGPRRLPSVQPDGPRRRPSPSPSRDPYTASSHTHICGPRAAQRRARSSACRTRSTARSSSSCFALLLDWVRIIPTVNVESAASRAKISTWIARWEAERRKRPPGVVPPYHTPEYS